MHTITLRFSSHNRGIQLVSTEFANGAHFSRTNIQGLSGCHAENGFVALALGTRAKGPHYFVDGKHGSALHEACKSKTRVKWAHSIFGKSEPGEEHYLNSLVSSKRTKGECVVSLNADVLKPENIFIFKDDVDISQDQEALLGILAFVTRESRVSTCVSAGPNGEEITFHVSVRPTTNEIVVKIVGTSVSQFTPAELETVLKRFEILTGAPVPVRDIKDGCVELTLEVPSDQVEMILRAIDLGRFGDLNIWNAWRHFPIPVNPSTEMLDTDLEECTTLIEEFSVVRSYYLAVMQDGGSVLFEESLDDTALDLARNVLREILDDPKLKAEASKIRMVRIFGNPEERRWKFTNSELSFYPGPKGEFTEREFPKIASAILDWPDRFLRLAQVFSYFKQLIKVRSDATSRPVSPDGDNSVTNPRYDSLSIPFEDEFTRGTVIPPPALDSPLVSFWSFPSHTDQESSSTCDSEGHGTHVAGILCGQGFDKNKHDELAKVAGTLAQNACSEPSAFSKELGLLGSLLAYWGFLTGTRNLQKGNSGDTVEDNKAAALLAGDKPERFWIWSSVGSGKTFFYHQVSSCQTFLELADSSEDSSSSTPDLSEDYSLSGNPAAKESSESWPAQCSLPDIALLDNRFKVIVWVPMRHETLSMQAIREALPGIRLCKDAANSLMSCPKWSYRLSLDWNVWKSHLSSGEKEVLALIYDRANKVTGYVRRVKLPSEEISTLTFEKHYHNWNWLATEWNLRMVDRDSILDSDGRYLRAGGPLDTPQRRALEFFLNRKSNGMLNLCYVGRHFALEEAPKPVNE